MIEEEIEDAAKYAQCALDNKADHPALAETFYKLANEELVHMGLLHAQAVAIIEEYKKKNGEPPEVMMKLYEILHKKHMEKAAYAKGLVGMFKS